MEEIKVLSNVSANRLSPGWRRLKFNDGTDQLRYSGDGIEAVIERVPDGEDIARRAWHIVDRDIPETEDPSMLYPPIVAGPFRSMRAAVVAYKVIYGSKGNTSE